MSYPFSWHLLSILIKPYIKSVKGLENLPPPPFIIASNHHSNLDSAIIGLTAGKYLDRRIHYLASAHPFKSKNFFYRAFSRFILFKLGQVILTDNRGVEDGVKFLKEGKIIGIFPQGRVVFGGREYLSGLKTGVAVMSLMARVPVIPVKISDASHLWLSFKKFPKLWKFKSLKAVVGKPLDFSQYYHQNLTKEVYFHLTQEIVGKIYDLDL